jgi:hypothetical protein
MVAFSGSDPIGVLIGTKRPSGNSHPQDRRPPRPSAAGSWRASPRIARTKQRTPELGLRMALGAPAFSSVGLVVRHGLRLSAIGIGAGVVGALALTQAMRNLLVGVTPTDPLTFIAMLVFFGAIAAGASNMPARRAAPLDPNAVLRQEWLSTRAPVPGQARFLRDTD